MALVLITGPRYAPQNNRRDTMGKDGLLLSGKTGGSLGASVAMSVGFGPNVPFAPSKFGVQCDFATTPTGSATLSLLGCLDHSATAGNRFVTLGSRTVTPGALTALSFNFQILDKPAKLLKAHMGAFTGTASFVVKAVATR